MNEIADVIAYTYRHSHHILGIEHLLRQLGHCHRAVLLAATGSKWSEGCEAGHEEVSITVIRRHESHDVTNIPC
jgi:hypothetical protein